MKVSVFRRDTTRRKRGVNLGIEQPADVRLEKLDRFLRLHGLPVGALRGQRVEGVGRREDASAYRNPRRRQEHADSRSRPSARDDPART